MSEKVIWKYELFFGYHGTQTEIEMPHGFEILDIQMQYGRPQMWAIGYPDADKVKRRFIIYGTGNPIPAKCGEYINTFRETNYVWHVFEEK